MKILFLSFSFFFTSQVFCSTPQQQQYDSLFERQEDLHNNYRNIYESLTNISKQESLKTWFRHYFKTSPLHHLYKVTDERVELSILGKDYRQLLYYFTLTGQISQASQTLGLYLISSHTLIDNFIHDPQSSAWNLETVEKLKRNHTPYTQVRPFIKRVERCFGAHLSDAGVKRGFSGSNALLLTRALESCVRNNPFVTQLNTKIIELFKNKKYYGAPFPVSFAGFVSGNTVTLHNRLPDKRRNILELGEQLNLILTAQVPQSNKLYKDLTIADFKQLMITPESATNDLFTTQEGFKNTIETEDLTGFLDSVLGPYAGKNLGIYGQMLQAISDAKESVFIDIFWMGGSIGMNLAKELFQKVNTDPNFSVFIITDNENKFQYGTQLDMIYRYMRAYSEKFTEKNFYITPAQINLKRTALPEFADLLITKNVVDDLSANNNIKSRLSKDGFHLLAKSDHTKAMIVDGKNPHLGKAFIGSKNWTDSSGGANRDEVAEISGPAVAILLNSFYYDTLKAFTLDTNARLGGEMVQNHIEAKFPGMHKRKAIEMLIRPIDVLNRTSNQQTVPFVAKGPSLVAPTQNNIYGTEMSPLEQNIQMILGAKHQILIDDQFLYDPKVIEALKVAKEQNSVEIYILLESLLSFPKDEEGQYRYSKGKLIYNADDGVQIPNNIFVPELTKLGIHVRSYKRPDHIVQAIGDDQKIHNHPMISPTFHVKSLSVDGVIRKDSETCNGRGFLSEISNSAPASISGSANKDIMTMSGGFREAQVATYSPETVASHDCLFWQLWDYSAVPTTGLEFDLPLQAEQMSIDNKEDFLIALRQILFTTYNFTKDLF